MKRVFHRLVLLFVIFLFMISIYHPDAGATSNYRVISVSNGGSVKGKLYFQGTPPDSKKITIRKNREFCGEEAREITWVRVNNGGLAEAVVYLDKVTEGKDWPAVEGTVQHLDLPGGKAEGLSEDGRYVINQKDCRFQPWIRVYKKGADLTVKNGDPVLHNINFREMIGKVKKTVFNVAQPGESGKPAKDLHKQIKPRRSIFLRINCEAHNFMFSWGLAAENPYAVVVNSDGTYEIRDIPAGSYRVRAWHPTLGIQDADVTVAAGGTATQNFTYESGKTYKTQ
jgi:hypothetical protein